MVPGIIVAVIVIVGIIWFAMGHMPATTVPNTKSTIAATPIISQNLPPGAYQISVPGLLAKLASYKSNTQFTANYVGYINTVISTNPTPIVGNLTTSYQRYNQSAHSITMIKSPQAGSFTSSVFYKNGKTTACTTNSITNYTCQTINSTFNASTFGLSVFIDALPANYSEPMLAINSSFDGIPCLEVAAKISSSYNNSGIILSSTQYVSSCLQQVYKIPLEINLTTVNTAEGSYHNGTSITPISPQSESVTALLRIVNLTNSSTQSEVESLPANAVMLG